MSSYLFLATVIAMVWLVYWAFQNDVPGFRGGVRGFFGMKKDPDGIKPKSFTPKWQQKPKERRPNPKRRW